MAQVVLGTDMSSHFGNVAACLQRDQRQCRGSLSLSQADFKTLVEKLGNDTQEWHEEKAMQIGKEERLKDFRHVVCKLMTSLAHCIICRLCLDAERGEGGL